MPIVIPNAYALALAAQGNGDFPIIGWHNVVTAAGLSATSASMGWPASNLANPSTVEVWKAGSTAAQTITATFNPEQVDYLGIAGHNLGSGQVHATIEGTADGSTWTELAAEFLPGDDRAILARWEPASLQGVRLVLTPDVVLPQVAVMQVGQLLVFERGVQAHMPLPYARNREVRNVRNTPGAFLGRIVVGGTLKTSAEFKYLSPEWLRAELDPFLEASAEVPFFFAWSPERYPTEVGFAWLTGEAVPSPADLIGRVNLSLPLEGLLT